MCEQQVHRGPDSRGIHHAEQVALGVQRLRIIDLETGDQPIYNEDRSVVVILNGEIYNYRDLRRELERSGHIFRTNGDTEVIAHLYEERGPALVRELNGMFSFAVWDERRRRLLLARDRVGKKPLFYAERNGWLSFASELGALMADSAIPREIDPSSIDCFLAYGYIPAPWSIWRDVRKLPPAHTLVWEEGHTSINRYWYLDYSHKRCEDTRELEEELRRLVAAAVRRRMIADVPLGAFLSGGVDSSIVVAEMAGASTEPVKTFSIGFEEAGYDELPRARIIAQRYATDHHEFVVQPDAVSLIPKLVRHYGEPYADSSAVPSFHLSELARRHVTVALNGDGGDESFAGYRRHIANAVTSGLDHVPHVMREAAARSAGLLPGGHDAKSYRSYIRRFVRSIASDAVDRYTSHVSIFDLLERQNVLDQDFRHDVDPTRARETLRAPWGRATGREMLDRLLEVDVSTYLPGDLLVKVDVAAMASSLEPRSPLLDVEVMEFAASLPAGHKARLTGKKRLLRSAYRRIVPDDILDGPKMGFAVPLDTWLRHRSLAAYASEVLLDEETLRRGQFRASAVRELLDSHQTGQGEHSAQIWALLMLEHWYRDVPR